MKTVTLEEFKKFKPCWLETAEGRRKLNRIGQRKESWTALDILNLPDEEVSVEDKLWAVLRSEFVEEAILHEFACRCAEEALKLVDNPDLRSVAAIAAKRRWLKGEISGAELAAASDAAWAARAARAASDAAWAAAWAASDAAWAASDAAWAASDAAWAASDAAKDAASDAAKDASDAAKDAARAKQAAILRLLLIE